MVWAWLLLVEVPSRHELQLLSPVCACPVVMLNQMDIDKSEHEIDELQDDDGDFEDEEDEVEKKGVQIYETALLPTTAAFIPTHVLHSE